MTLLNEILKQFSIDELLELKEYIDKELTKRGYDIDV